MKNKHFDNSNTVAMRAPAGGVVGGRFYKFGGLFGVANKDAAENEAFTLDCDGQFRVTLTPAADLNIGDALYLAAGAITADAGAAGAIYAGKVGGSVNGEYGRPDQALLEAGDEGTIDLIVFQGALSTAAEAVEQGGGADA